VQEERILDLRGVRVELGGRTVLQDIDVQLRPGEIVGLIGPNGAGKTTLLKVILGLIPPDGGAVRIGGRAPRAARGVVGYVPQRFSPDPDLPLRARDLVALGFDGDRWGFSLGGKQKRLAVEEALRWVDALRYADQAVGRLSGGELQRLLVAQALIAGPRLLLLDEPFSNLDLRSQDEIVALVGRVAHERGVTVLLVTHDMNPILGVMDRILYLARGQAALGTIDEVVRPDVLGALYGHHVDVLRVHGRILVVGAAEAESLACEA
jgi:zinc/manganese transport system ATP-binding protein